MHELARSTLAAVIGGQATDGCSVTNEMAEPLSIASLTDGVRTFTLAPGGSGTVAPGQFLAIQKAPRGEFDLASCSAGARLSIKRDTRWIMRTQPHIDRK